MSKVFIIAEAGVNHNGSLENAKQLIDAAVEAGADAVKFQSFLADRLVCKSARKADYQLQTTNTQESQYQMLKRLELTRDRCYQLWDYCKSQNICFLSTPFDEQSLKELCTMGMDRIKIPSGEITNYPLLVQAAAYQKPILLSSGMSTLQEVKEAISVLQAKGPREITVLHCTTEYPANLEDVNLNAMTTLRNELHLEVGYSDHTLGIEVPIAAAALGASVIEKHFTLDRHKEGPDHKASLEPKELKHMVQAIRSIEKAMGSARKEPSQAEVRNQEIIRKSIVASRTIKKGELLTAENLTTKRPATGLSPMRWEEVIGTKAVKDYNEEEPIVLTTEMEQQL